MYHLFGRQCRERLYIPTQTQRCLHCPHLTPEWCMPYKQLVVKGGKVWPFCYCIKYSRLTPSSLSIAVCMFVSLHHYIRRTARRSCRNQQRQRLDSKNRRATGSLLDHPSPLPLHFSTLPQHTRANSQPPHSIPVLSRAELCHHSC